MRSGEPELVSFLPVMLDDVTSTFSDDGGGGDAAVCQPWCQTTPCWFCCVLAFFQTPTWCGCSDSGPATLFKQFAGKQPPRCTAHKPTAKFHIDTDPPPPSPFSPPSLWNSSFVRDNVQVVNMQGARGRGSRSRSIYTGKHEERICCDAAVWLNIGATLWSCGWSRMQIIRHRYRGTVWRLIDKMRVGSWRSWWLWLVLLWCSSQFEVQTKTGRGVSASEPDRSHFFLHTFQSRTFWSHWIGH